MPSLVTEIPAADSARALAHFESALSFETDCWDVHHALGAGGGLRPDRRAQPGAVRTRPRAAGAQHPPRQADRLAPVASTRPDTLFVLYCAGPHCNGAHRGAIRVARLGLPVKVMIGGMSGWRAEGFAVESGALALTS